MLAICAPFYNVLTACMQDLETIRRRERPEGRPLSFERDIARRMLGGGASYQYTLWMIMKLRQQPSAFSPSADYTFGHGHELLLERKQADAIRKAVDREWETQFGESAPVPPRKWWKNPDWMPDDVRRPDPPHH